MTSSDCLIQRQSSTLYTKEDLAGLTIYIVVALIKSNLYSPLSKISSIRISIPICLHRSCVEAFHTNNSEEFQGDSETQSVSWNDRTDDI